MAGGSNYWCVDQNSSFVIAKIIGSFSCGLELMSQAHLQELHATLTHRGWNILVRHRGDTDVRGAATWEVRRRGTEGVVRIDFPGFGGLGEDIPLEESPGCNVRDHEIHLYFSRINRSHSQWTEDLESFVLALDSVLDA